MFTKVALAVAVLVALAAIAEGGCSLTIQFDNSEQSVTSDKRNKDKILKVLGEKVFLVEDPLTQVAEVGGINQGGLLNKQATVTYFAEGPTTNGADVCDNCKTNSAGKWFGLRSSTLEKELSDATDTWWPGDSVDVQNANCSPA